MHEAGLSELHYSASMRVIITEERSKGFIRCHSNWIHCRGVEESVDSIGCFTFVCIIVMVNNVTRVLVKWGKMSMPRKWPWFCHFPCTFDCLQNLLFLQPIPPHCYFLWFHFNFYLIYSCKSHIQTSKIDT